MRIHTYQVTFEKNEAGILAHKSKYCVQLLQDKQYPGMWRVRRPDGSLSDMVNFDRAKDAALGLVESLEFVNG